MAKGHTPPNSHKTKYGSEAWVLAQSNFPGCATKTLHVRARCIQIGLNAAFGLDAKGKPVPPQFPPNPKATEPKLSSAQRLVGEITIGQIKKMQHGLADVLCWLSGMKCALNLVSSVRENYTQFDMPPGVEEAQELNAFLYGLIKEDETPKRP